MIFVDTSAIYALADRDDPRHSEARFVFRDLLSSGQGLLTHNYVLVESMALLQRRLGLDSALKFAKSEGAFHVVWIDEDVHRQAVQRLKRAEKRQVSLVDQVSFLVMRARRVEVAFAFDQDFALEGFRLYRAST